MQEPQIEDYVVETNEGNKGIDYVQYALDLKDYIKQIKKHKSLSRIKMKCPNCNETEKIWIPLGHSHRPYVQCESCGTWFNPNDLQDNHPEVQP